MYCVPMSQDIGTPPFATAALARMFVCQIDEKSAVNRVVAENKTVSDDEAAYMAMQLYNEEEAQILKCITAAAQTPSSGMCWFVVRYTRAQQQPMRIGQRCCDD